MFLISANISWADISSPLYLIAPFSPSLNIPCALSPQAPISSSSTEVLRSLNPSSKVPSSNRSRMSPIPAPFDFIVLT